MVKNVLETRSHTSYRRAGLTPGCGGADGPLGPRPATGVSTTACILGHDDGERRLKPSRARAGTTSAGDLFLHVQAIVHHTL